MEPSSFTFALVLLVVMTSSVVNSTISTSGVVYVSFTVVVPSVLVVVVLVSVICVLAVMVVNTAVISVAVSVAGSVASVTADVTAGFSTGADDVSLPLWQPVSINAARKKGISFFIDAPCMATGSPMDCLLHILLLRIYFVRIGSRTCCDDVLVIEFYDLHLWCDVLFHVRLLLSFIGIVLPNRKALVGRNKI